MAEVYVGRGVQPGPAVVVVMVVRLGIRVVTGHAGPGMGYEVLLLARCDSWSIHIPPGEPHPLADDLPTVTNLTRHNI